MRRVLGAALAAFLFLVASAALSWFAGVWWHGPAALAGGGLFVFAVFAAAAALSNWQ